MRRLLSISAIAFIITLFMQPGASGRVAGTHDAGNDAIPDIYSAVIDSIQRYQEENKFDEALVLARKLYTSALELQSDYALFMAHGTCAMIYSDWQDSSSVLFHIEKAL